MINIMYVAFPIHAKPETAPFSYKDNYSAKLQTYIGVGVMDKYIDETQTALDIFRLAVFFGTK